MKIITLLFLMIAVTAGYAEMRITGVMSGPLNSSTGPRLVEFYVDTAIADLSIYGIGIANNGGGSDGQEYTFPADSIGQGTFLYAAYQSSSFNDWFEFNPDYVNTKILVNGDDAVELFKNGSVIDTFGDIDNDGTGTSWEYTDGWAYRKNGTGLDPTVNNTNNYSYSGPNALDGETSNATAGVPFPTGTFVIPEPAIFGIIALALLFFRRK